MSDFDELKELYRNKTSSQKLAALRNQISTPLSIVRGYSELLKRIDLNDPSTFGDDFGIWVKKISKAGEDIREIVDALTSDISPE